MITVVKKTPLEPQAGMPPVPAMSVNGLGGGGIIIAGRNEYCFNIPGCVQVRGIPPTRNIKRSLLCPQTVRTKASVFREADAPSIRRITITVSNRSSALVTTAEVSRKLTLLQSSLCQSSLDLFVC